MKIAEGGGVERGNGWKRKWIKEFSYLCRSFGEARHVFYSDLIILSFSPTTVEISLYGGKKNKLNQGRTAVINVFYFPPNGKAGA